jgi:hypothetical protein
LVEVGCYYLGVSHLFAIPVSVFNGCGWKKVFIK